MSFVYALSGLTSLHKKSIKELCQARSKPTQYMPNPETVFTYEVNRNDDEIVLPIRMFKHLELNDLPNDVEFKEIEGEFVSLLYMKDTDQRHRDQNVVAKNAIEMLKREHSCLLSLHTGYGKSIVAIYIACKLRLITVVLCKQKELGEQWKTEIEKFTTAKVKLLTKSSKEISELRSIVYDDYDMYIICIVKAIRVHERNPRAFEGVGTLIIDECHNIMASEFSKSLICFKPKYLIGLSATPDRADGLDKLFKPYFGDRTDYIVREEVKSFTVIKYLTGFVPDIQQTYRGTLDWTNVLTSLATNPQRQKLIADIAHSYSTECIAIISKRKAELHGIAQILSDTYKERIALFIESDEKKNIPSDFRILLTTRQKAGEGFNDMRLTMIILTTDTKDVRQNEGRVRNDHNIVVDLVDAFSTFEKHWKLREKWYRKRGATIEIINANTKDLSSERTRMLPPNV